jgi:hypothetical protein
MDTQLSKYYLKKMSGGRSLVARAADFILLRVVILAVLFITMLQCSHSIKVAIPVSLLLTAAFSILMAIYRRKKAEKFYKKDLQKMREKCLLESLTLMNTEEYADYMRRLFPGLDDIQFISNGFIASYNGGKASVLHNHPKSSCGVPEIVDAYRLIKGADKTTVISLSDFTVDAAVFAKSVSAVLIPGSEVLLIACDKGLLPDEKSAEQRAKKEIEAAAVSFERVKRTALNKTKVRAYIYCGLITMFWPLIGGWRIYYTVISLICFILAYISFRKGKDVQKSEGIDVS